MHSSGKTLVLRAGDYQATLVTVGAGLAELTYAGQHLVLPHPPETLPLAHMGKVLIPWPNRVAKGTGTITVNGFIYRSMITKGEPPFTVCWRGVTGRLRNIPTAQRG